MRKYEILDQNDVVLRTQEHEDSFSPALLAGERARLVEQDSVPVTERVIIETDVSGA